MKTLLFILLIIAVNSFGQKHLGSKAIGTEATVYENSDFVKRSFDKIVVQTGTLDAKTDKKIIAEYSDLNVKLVSWRELFPPVREYSESDIKEICTKNNIDGLIRIKENNEKRVGLYASKMSELELTLIDLKINVNAVKFVGRSALGAFSSGFAPDKTIIKFVRMTYDDFKKDNHSLNK